MKGPVTQVDVFDINDSFVLTHDDGKFLTKMTSFKKSDKVHIRGNHGHFGYVLDGEIRVSYYTQGDMPRRITRHLFGGDYFSVDGEIQIASYGRGIIVSAHDYRAMNLFGGPLEEFGRFPYINGATNTLLINPVVVGDPALWVMYMKSGSVQTPHEHNSLRVGIITRGSGECVLPDGAKLLMEVGKVFIIPTDLTHSFNTYDEELVAVNFHALTVPEQGGMTDDNNSMVNNTSVDGVSAKFIPEIRTKK